MSDETKLPRSERVYRPLGLTLAIIAAAIWYGGMPLFNLYFLQRVGAAAEDAFITGGVEIGIWDYINALLGGIILIICILAWGGRPSWIRFVFIASIVLPTLVNLFRIYQVLTATVDPLTSGSADEVWNNILRCQVPGMILIPLYVTWYLNRAPARAFYRRIPRSALAPEWETSSKT
ncbi:MAG TPA: hypothetical protein VHP83_24775 [Aggregatilineaceae bacterium]|nr:hypothetical protein [Aggregatilineaceae bacterium]